MQHPHFTNADFEANRWPLTSLRWIGLLFILHCVCHVHLQNEDERDDRLEVITDDEEEAEEGEDGRDGFHGEDGSWAHNGVLKSCPVIAWPGYLSKIKIFTGSSLLVSSAHAPCSPQPHPSLVRQFILSCSQSHFCFLWHLSSYVTSYSIIFAFNFYTCLWLNHTRIYNLKVYLSLSLILDLTLWLHSVDTILVVLHVEHAIVAPSLLPWPWKREREQNQSWSLVLRTCGLAGRALFWDTTNTPLCILYIMWQMNS